MLKKLLTTTAIAKGIHPLRRRLQKEPYYRFQSFEELQLAATWGIKIDVNTACVDDWLRLPGLSIHQARKIVQLVERGLHFTCIEDVAAALDVPVQQVQPWAKVLQFCYYEPALNALEPVAINVNTATIAELAAIPAVDTFLARAIVYYRKEGPYQDLANLQDRLRLTTAVTSELLHYLRF